ncbi:MULTISPECIES: thiamine diphosphokinase [Bacillaceae]|uniref:thiamine diphosphokinase n=1 Tax=Bacillaceae TaxID=186817 RepID=UPI001E40E223|nr:MULTISPECIES: thiamine diphosphokinase [Bacillaceae]MCE4048358.1 thiamine diphosphokinase [Bacillus sp. Au-Bac7]MCM3029031.1 thiamine diphosphokinase [Niallia sp. MER 6]MDL0435082.1 thiamine diphosphokinase [Niallia sp. SS-2023]UPO88885.1 thiamine diphosphokinase [Niallia sp. Man26]
MKINIMAGGPAGLIPSLPGYMEDNSKWVGVDRGALYLVERDIPIFASFGDFDSVTDAERQRISSHSHELKTFKPEKDETDMELAINWAISFGASTIRLFGATGGRLDHTIANLQLLLKYLTEHPDVTIEIIDKKNIVTIVNAGTYKLKREESRRYVSFFPYGSEITGLTLQGFKYPLNDRDLPVSSTLCISNEIIEDYGTFSFASGILMVVRSHD